jgi:hypothetical protein
VIDDLVAFLRARLDDTERVARAAPGPSWEKRQVPGDFDESVALEEYVAVADPDRNTVVLTDVDREVMPFLLEHDPARVLAEVDAKRRRLARHGQERRILTLVDDEGHHTLMSFYVCTWCTPGTSIGPGQPILEWPCPDIRDDATVYRDHPDYRPEWAPDAEGRSA